MVIFLLVIGLALIILNVKAVNKEKYSFKTVLQVREENISEAEVIAGELRREFSETILELQKEIIELKGKSQKFEASAIIAPNKEDIKSETNISVSEAMDNIFEKQIEEIPSEMNESGRDIKRDDYNKIIKIEEVGKMLNKGVSIDEICEKLQLGKGEVLLIKDLYLK
jgi:F0F1-type ATP synthase membrane subunit b/b'